MACSEPATNDHVSVTQVQAAPSSHSAGRSGHNSGVTDDIYTRARQYIAFVAAHARRDPEHFLISGSHYRGFSHMLSLRRSLVPQRTLKPFPGVVARELVPSGLDRVSFDATSGYNEFAKYTGSVPQNPCLVFVRGYMTPDWLSLFGSHYHIDIEFFRQHLDFLEDRDFYDLPPAPCNSANVLRLKIPTIFKRQVAWSLSEVQRLRQSEKKAVWKHQRGLSCAGESLIRRFSVHNESTFTIQQDISIYIGTKHGTWSTIVWFDSGRELSDSTSVPWQNLSNKRVDSDEHCVPIVQHVPAKLLSSLHELSDKRGEAAGPSHQQSMCHLPEQYGTTLNIQAARNDPYYALSELFFFYISSESQFLNMLQRQMDQLMRSYRGRENLALDDLHYTKQLVNSHAQSIEDLHCKISAQPQRQFPSSSGSSSSFYFVGSADTEIHGSQGLGRSLEAATAHARLLDSLTHLQRLASQLSQRATEDMAFVSNGVVLEESRRAMLKADSMERLTMLAFFFLPLSFTASLFGANFRELGTGDMSIWIMFVTLVPVSLFSTILCFWNQISLAKVAEIRKRWSNSV